MLWFCNPANKVRILNLAPTKEDLMKSNKLIKKLNERLNTTVVERQKYKETIEMFRNKIKKKEKKLNKELNIIKQLRIILP